MDLRTPGKPTFLDGSGEMSMIIRSYPWSRTSLGDIVNWPIGLRVTLANLLHSPFPAFLFWGDDYLCFYNDAFRPSLGIEGKHPAIGKKGHEVWEEIWDFVGPLVHKVKETGEPAWYENQLVPFFRNGHMEEIYWTFSYSPVFSDDSRISGVLATCIETTESVMAKKKVEEMITLRTKELQEAHQDLLEANQYLQTIINLFKEPMQVLEPVIENGEIVDFIFKLSNQAYANYAQTTPELLKGRKVGDVFPGYFETISFTKPVETYKTGKDETFEVHYDQDGLNLYNRMSATKLNNDVILHFTDFTELKLLQLELVKKIEELERSNQNLLQFAHAASHDLKEPVRKIQMFITQLKDQLKDQMNPAITRSFEKIEASSGRIRLLIDDLLSYSEVHQKPEQKEVLHFDSIISQVLEDLDDAIAHKKARVEVTGAGSLLGYQRQLEQVFLNLIGNSLKYSRPGFAPVIRITQTQLKEGNKKMDVIEVADNGIGFDAEYADKIFHLFARLHSKSSYEGTGIGLSIVKKIIDNHEGRIEVHSIINQGTTFRILLPAQEAAS